MNRSLLTALLVSATQLVFSPAYSNVPTVSPDAEAVSKQVCESTMPSQYTETVSPELAAKYSYKQDGEFTTASQLPTYEWMPVNHTPNAIVIGVHGLTLHGRRYRVLARMLAVNGIGVVSMDMRGFGRCKFDPDNKFSTAEDDKTKISHHKSYDDLVKIVRAVRLKYPGRRLIVMGESLGCTFAVKLASEFKDLVDGIILSAPAVKVNPKMYVGHGTVAQGVKAIVAPGHAVNLDSFIHNLVSDRTDVVNEMLDDPLILKSVPLLNLLATDEFVSKTADWGKGVSNHLPVLILQGSTDSCVSAKHVTDLTNAMPSDDQTLSWRGNYGHLQLETIFLRPSILNALINWLYDHGVEAKARDQKVQDSINQLGGRLVI